METTEILRIITEVLIAGLTWYLKNKLDSTKETHLKELKAYQLTVDNLKLTNEKLTEKLSKKKVNNEII